MNVRTGGLCFLIERGEMSRNNQFCLAETILSENEIQKRILELARCITEEYKESKRIVLIGILKGSFLFLSDLVRAIPLPLEIDFFQAKSYGSGTKSSQSITIEKDISLSIADADVILVEDIIDSGNTLQKIKNILTSRNPKSLKLCILLDKPARRETPVTLDWVGFEIPDVFVVGYGLDAAEQFRNLPYLAEARESL